MILESDLSPLASDAKRPNPVAEILAEQLESRQVIAAIFSTDEGTKNHSLAVAEQYCLLAGAWIKQYPNSKAELVDTGLGALLHDIGKKAVPLEILRNSGPLLKIEWQVLKLHSNAGSHELSDTLDFRPIADTAKYHHEKWDGTGYPDGLKGEKIPPSC
jgi:HD-GYP domain-containing protein (c-di-GMP phosphodiesterase class II)